MAKIGLVFVDVPRNCEECQFNYDYLSCMASDDICNPFSLDETRRPIGCPIKVYEVRANEKDNEINN